MEIPKALVHYRLATLLLVSAVYRPRQYPQRTFQLRSPKSQQMVLVQVPPVFDVEAVPTVTAARSMGGAETVAGTAEQDVSLV
jgi:hypothetical protein